MVLITKLALANLALAVGTLRLAGVINPVHAVGQMIAAFKLGIFGTDHIAVDSFFVIRGQAKIDHALAVIAPGIAHALRIAGVTVTPAVGDGIQLACRAIGIGMLICGTTNDTALEIIGTRLLDAA